MTPTELAAVLVSMGCPTEKAPEMAAQLEKRAGQLSARTGRSLDQARNHLLELMKQGWAAKSRAGV